MKTRVQVFQVLIAVVFLAFGLAVYLFDRSADRVYFVPDWWNAGADNEQLFGSLGANFPSFVHVFAFILITGALLAPWRFRIASICLLWFSIDSLFELAQYDAIAARIAEFVPDWFQDVILLENTADYFLAGTFDAFDILWIAAGSTAAYGVLHLFRLAEHGDDA